jgi:cyanate lyase
MHNKRPKDAKLCTMIRAGITKSRKYLGLSFNEAANELGLTEGTLSNKLKPAKAENDMTLSEYIHFLELTGDLTSLEYIAGLFDMVLVPKSVEKASVADINLLVDMANIENSDVFRVVKEAMADGIIDEAEQKAILKEIEDAQKANARLKDMVLHLATNKGCE